MKQIFHKGLVDGRIVRWDGKSSSYEVKYPSFTFTLVYVNMLKRHLRARVRNCLSVVKGILSTSVADPSGCTSTKLVI